MYTRGLGSFSLATIAVLFYADDMVLLNTDAGKLVEMLRVIDFWVSEMAMCINAAKTKIMSVDRGAP